MPTEMEETGFAPATDRQSRDLGLILPAPVAQVYNAKYWLIPDFVETNLPANIYQQ